MVRNPISKIALCLTASWTSFSPPNLTGRIRSAGYFLEVHVATVSPKAIPIETHFIRKSFVHCFSIVNDMINWWLTEEVIASGSWVNEIVFRLSLVHVETILLSSVLNARPPCRVRYKPRKNLLATGLPRMQRNICIGNFVVEILEKPNWAIWSRKHFHSQPRMVKWNIELNPLTEGRAVLGFGRMELYLHCC